MNSKTLVLCSTLLTALWVLLSAGISSDAKNVSYGYSPGDRFRGIKVEMNDEGNDHVYGASASIMHFWSIHNAKSRLMNAYLSQKCRATASEYVSICIDGDETTMKQCLLLDGINFDATTNAIYLQMNDYRTQKNEYGLANEPKTFVLGDGGVIQKVYTADEAWSQYVL